MSDAGNKAVFLSYASQDAETVSRIAEALRASGVEVWFDQSELVGGDAWDGKIRKQIKECALFVPVISAHTQARLEGYFRREWRTAADRMEDMDDGQAFLVPVVIDETSDRDARVPERFRERQWTRLRPGEPMTGFATHVKKILASDVADTPGAKAVDETARAPETDTPHRRQRVSRGWVWAVLAGAAGLALAGQFFRKPTTAESPAEKVRISAPLSEARATLARAWVLINRPTYARADLDAAAQLLEHALTLTSADAEIVAASAQVDIWYYYNSFDRSPERMESARAKTSRAMTLAPESFEARLAQANFYVRAAAQTTGLSEAERLLKDLLREKPAELRALHALALLYRATERDAEAMEIFARMEALPDGAKYALTTKAWLHFFRGRFREAEATVDAALAIGPTVHNNRMLKIWILLYWHGDLAGARDLVVGMPAADVLEDAGAHTAYRAYVVRRESANALRAIESVPRAWMYSVNYTGPKALLSAQVRRLLPGGEAAAQSDFRSALELIEPRRPPTRTTPHC